MMIMGNVRSSTTNGIILGVALLVLIFTGLAALTDSHEDGRFHPDCPLCLFLINGLAPDVQIVSLEFIPEILIENQPPVYETREVFSSSVDLTCIQPHAPPVG
jgi:hypothetical protein